MKKSAEKCRFLLNKGGESVNNIIAYIIIIEKEKFKI